MMDDDAEAYEDQSPEEPAALDTEADVTCPHCGATVRLTLDPAGGRAQDYVEACGTTPRGQRRCSSSRWSEPGRRAFTATPP